jgi:hypothetical protein
MEVDGGKKSTRIPFDISPVFFHIISKFVQAVVITHDEIFQALEVEGDALLTKPILDLGFDGVVRWKSPASLVFFQFAKHVEVQGGRVGAVRWAGWGPSHVMTSA